MAIEGGGLGQFPDDVRILTQKVSLSGDLIRLVFRERAVAAYEAGEGAYVDVAALFGVGHRTLERRVTQWVSCAADVVDGSRVVSLQS